MVKKRGGGQYRAHTSLGSHRHERTSCAGEADRAGPFQISSQSRVLPVKHRNPPAEAAFAYMPQNSFDALGEESGGVFVVLGLSRVRFHQLQQGIAAA
jgi:hypothetical protein